MIKLSKIIEDINKDPEIHTLSLNEQLDIQTYYYLVEIMDKSDSYQYESTDKFSAVFLDDNGIKHFIRIIYQPLSIPRYDVKIGFYDEQGKPSYERPNLHYNLGPDQKIFNTHIHILLDDFFDVSDFFGEANWNMVALPATDYPRYRLYRMALTKFLNKEKYEFFDDLKHPNTIVIKKKDFVKD